MLHNPLYTNLLQELQGIPYRFEEKPDWLAIAKSEIKSSMCFTRNLQCCCLRYCDDLAVVASSRETSCGGTSAFGLTLTPWSLHSRYTTHFCHFPSATPSLLQWIWLSPFDFLRSKFKVCIYFRKDLSYSHREWHVSN